ncbi:MAG TPA: pentapeptide repeat-containing protein [Candidatus Methanoperedens sp.]|nr:pentapeptide repeat-containing protein [Candidatus Methanoperedens sp.]
MERRPGYVGPLLLLAIGFTLLFNNLGLFPWEIWGHLLRYWPVILILSGIQIFARHSRSGLMYFAAVFLSILLIIGAVFLAWNGYPPSTGTELREAILDNAGYNDYNFADLDNANFSNSILNGADMNFATMQNVNFSNSSLKGANMNFADLKYAKFNNAGLKGVNLNFADLKYADLSNAVLDGANINFVNLEGANMTGARMEGVNHRFTRTSISTICPDSKNGPCW